MVPLAHHYKKMAEAVHDMRYRVVAEDLHS